MVFNAKTCLQALRTQFKEFHKPQKGNCKRSSESRLATDFEDFTAHDLPEFREFFVINDLKAQLQANITLICDLKKQIKSVKEASNEAKVKNDIDVIEMINIELEHSVAKLLAANEQLHKENEHLKQTYKELFDSIKKTKVQNKDNSESLISQINQKFVENADLKAQLQEKVFANAALKNELRKIKGNSVDTKFTKASILGKPSLEPSRTHLVVRQPNAFTFERPRISRPRFASQVDEKNDLSKTVTPHYLPKVRESAAAKPHQVNAPNYSRNSHKESYGSNDMVHAYFLEDARKMTQDKTRIPNHRDMASTRAHCTPNACTPKLRNIYRSSPVSKCRQRFSLNKSSAVHEKPHTPRSYLRWKPTGRIFKTVSLRWIPTGKVFIDSTTKVDSEPPNGSNDDITNPYECNQTLLFQASFFIKRCLDKPVQTSLLNVKSDWRNFSLSKERFYAFKKRKVIATPSSDKGKCNVAAYSEGGMKPTALAVLVI
ncbi:hypothetical protein Tco_0886882 [Tanacetum coccineum]